MVEIFPISNTLECNNHNSIQDIPPFPIVDTTVCNNNCKSIQVMPPVPIVWSNNRKSVQDLQPVQIVYTPVCNNNNSMQPLPDNFRSHKIPVTLKILLINCYSNFYTQTIPFQYSGWIVYTLLTHKILMVMMICFFKMVDQQEHVQPFFLPEILSEVLTITKQWSKHGHESMVKFEMIKTFSNGLVWKWGQHN